MSSSTTALSARDTSRLSARAGRGPPSANARCSAHHQSRRLFHLSLPPFYVVVKFDCIQAGHLHLFEALLVRQRFGGIHTHLAGYAGASR